MKDSDYFFQVPTLFQKFLAAFLDGSEWQNKVNSKIHRKEKIKVDKLRRWEDKDLYVAQNYTAHNPFWHTQPELILYLHIYHWYNKDLSTIQSPQL